MKRLLLVITVLLGGCHGRPPIDERLLSCLEEARAWQHRADLHLADGALSDAIGDVEQVLAIPFPAGAPEGEEARLDARARLGKLLLAAGDESRALEAVELGRKEASFDSFYRAHLETVAGEIQEARAHRLETDPEAAKQARKEALAAYERSIAINKRVQARLAREAP
jgi:tetratricopeptide (TPR) repeat protein